MVHENQYINVRGGIYVSMYKYVSQYNSNNYQELNVIHVSVEEFNADVD